MKKYFAVLLAAFISGSPLLAYAMSDYSSDGNFNLSGDLKDGVREIQVEAFRYGYKPDPIVVNEGEKVRLIATSSDVTHGLQIKEFGVNATLAAGEKKSVEFIADKAGVFTIHCSVYCGPGHAAMTGKLIVRKK